MPLKKIRKLFIKTVLLGLFFFLFFFIFAGEVRADLCSPVGKKCSPPNTCLTSCCKCGPNGRTGLDYSCASGAAGWCACAAQYNYPPGWQTNCGGVAPTPTPGGGDTTSKTCGQICSEHGSTDGSSGCYCSGNSSCPSPLVSYGRSSDCRTCCGWPSLPSCQVAPPPPTPTPTPVPSCTMSLSPSSLSLQTGY